MKIFKNFILFISISILLVGCPSNESDNDNEDNETGISYFPVLVENFTNVDCVGCADVHLALSTVLEYYLENDEMPVVIEFHHLLYPNDPYHNAAADVHDSRGNYYGFTSIPQLVIDGSVLTLGEANSADEIHSKIDSVRAVDKLASISISTTSESDSIGVSLTISAQDTIISYLYCYLVREKTELDEAGANGLTEYDWVAAAAFTDVDGQSIAIPAGGEETYDFKVAVPEELSGVTTDGYAVVAFIQSRDKTVLGAAAKKIE